MRALARLFCAELQNQCQFVKSRTPVHVHVHAHQFGNLSFVRMASTENKVIKCRAAVAWKASAPMTIEEVEVSPPKAGEVRFKVVSTGLCHSDWHMLSGQHSAFQFPLILGHEGAGVVESVGPGVTDFQPGDHVIPMYAAQCRECKYCKRPETNFCDRIKPTQVKGLMPDGTPRFSCKGQPVYHFMGCSTFSEYTVVSKFSLCKIDKKAPLEKVCLLGCAIPTGLGAVMNTAQVKPGTTVAIWGLGGIGLAAAMGAKKAGAKRVIGVDINPSKFELGRKFGCTEFVNPKDHTRPVQQVLVEMTDGGVDYAIECCGTVQTMRAAFEACHKGWGVAVAIGLIQAGKEVSFVPYDLLEGRTWKGSSFGGWKGLEAVPQMVDWYMKGEIMVDEFINEYIKLEEINVGFEKMLKGESIRTVILF